MIRADVQFETYGSIFLIRPLTHPGKAWLDENTDGLWLDGALVVEYRYAAEIEAGLIDDGLEVN